MPLSSGPNQNKGLLDPVLAHWLQNLTACACLLTMIILMSISAGGFRLIVKAGTSADLCTSDHPHPDGEQRFEDVCVGGGTEAPRSGIHDGPYPENGTYFCACCGAPLFPATTKFDSGTGWPSFWAPVEGDAIGYRKDQLYSVEVHCHKCGAHLGHVFDDGAGSTGYRYCINSVCLHYDETVTMKEDTGVPWVANAYMLLIFIVGGLGGTCLLSARLAPHCWKCGKSLLSARKPQSQAETVVP